MFVSGRVLGRFVDDLRSVLSDRGFTLDLYSVDDPYEFYFSFVNTISQLRISLKDLRGDLLSMTLSKRREYEGVLLGLEKIKDFIIDIEEG